MNADEIAKVLPDYQEYDFEALKAVIEAETPTPAGTASLAQVWANVSIQGVSDLMDKASQQLEQLKSIEEIEEEIEESKKPTKKVVNPKKRIKKRFRR